jgi:hypothetical protein
MRTNMTEAPQLALASFLSDIWETRYAALRRTALNRTTDALTREGDDDLSRHHSNKSEQLSMLNAPPGFNGLPRTCAELVACNWCM